ncbi:MAG: Oligopeptide transport system permease protein OppB [Chlamydiales bacterium]|nr:Oligopeptide transport system permease protein OppB [Chlamydiales bacterium]MCH9620447.1 Oligopeptide transport system permease protein OppB [Chlamydiales bacterium]MCH9623433.1 Oligopeptide transport system permease protein OppB [Chlamydiales bacterium]
MRYYLAKRFLSNIVALWVIITITFFLMKAIPGDPFTQEKALPKEILDSLYEHYKLNDPLPVQYVNYLKSIVKWDLGPSFKYKARTVNDIIRQGFPISITLGVEAALLAISLGVLLGSIAAFFQNKWQDYGSMLIAVIGISVPSFILAAFLQYIFAIKLDLFPVARWGTFRQSVLPALSLSALPMAFIARLTRANMVEVLSMDYIKLARAKGLGGKTVIIKHAMRNALLPVVTYLGMIVVNILTGSFIIEKIFGIPGLGQWFINSVTNRDYTVIMGLTVFYSIILLTAIFLTDIVYGWVDPRLKLRNRLS